MGLQEFWVRHLRPTLRCAIVDLCIVIPWRLDVIPPLRVTLESPPHILRKGMESTPYRVSVEYCNVEWLQDTRLKLVVNFIRNVAPGVPLDVVVHGAFHALLAKTPHWPIPNAQHVLYLTTMGKLIGAHIANKFVTLLARTTVICCMQFMVHASSFVADSLLVLHDFIWFQCLRGQCICMVVDVVRQGYGSVGHDTLMFLPLPLLPCAALISNSWYSMLHITAPHVSFYLGGVMISHTLYGMLHITDHHTDFILGAVLTSHIVQNVLLITAAHVDLL